MQTHMQSTVSVRVSNADRICTTLVTGQNTGQTLVKSRRLPSVLPTQIASVPPWVLTGACRGFTEGFTVGENPLLTRTVEYLSNAGQLVKYRRNSRWVRGRSGDRYTGQILVKYRSNTGQTRLLAGPAEGQPLRRQDEAVAAGELQPLAELLDLVKYWSNTGQILVKRGNSRVLATTAARGALSRGVRSCGAERSNGIGPVKHWSNTSQILVKYDVGRNDRTAIAQQDPLSAELKADAV
jgi:hypothetical protein